MNWGGHDSAYNKDPNIQTKDFGGCLSRVAQLVGVSTHTPKGYGFDPWWGHISRLQFLSLVRTCTGGNRSMFLWYINVCLSVCPSLSPFFSLKSINRSFIKDLKKRLRVYQPWGHGDPRGETRRDKYRWVLATESECGKVSSGFLNSYTPCLRRS